MKPEDTTEVVLYTPHFIIEGRIALVPGARLTDFIRESDDFIAVTQVTVKDHGGTERFQVPFLDLRKASIEIAYPRPTA